MTTTPIELYGGRRRGVVVTDAAGHQRVVPFPNDGTYLAADGTFTPAPGSSGGTGRWEPLTNGNVAAPELVFSLGDVIMVFVP